MSWGSNDNIEQSVYQQLYLLDPTVYQYKAGVVDQSYNEALYSQFFDPWFFAEYFFWFETGDGTD